MAQRSLYKEALADAKVLKEMAKQAAEKELVEKHSAEFKNLLLNKLFEAEGKDDELLLDEEDKPETDDLNIDDFEKSSQEDALSPDMQNGEVGGKPDNISGDFNSSDPTETVKKVPFAALDNKGVKESADSDEEIEIDLDGITPESEKSLGNINKEVDNTIDISSNDKNKDAIADKEPEHVVEEPTMFDDRPEETNEIKESISISKDQFMLYLEKDLEQEERIKKLEENISQIINKNKKQEELLTIYEKQLKETNKKLEESIKLEYKFNILADSSLSGRQKKGLIEAIDKTKDLKSIGNLVEAVKNNFNNQNEAKNSSLIEFKTKKTNSAFFVTKEKPIITESLETENWEKFRELAGIQGKK